MAIASNHSNNKSNNDFQLFLYISFSINNRLGNSEQLIIIIEIIQKTFNNKTD